MWQRSLPSVLLLNRPYFPSSSSFLISYHLSISLSSLPHPYYPPPSFVSSLTLSLSLICIFCYLRFLAAFPGGGAAAQTQWSWGSRWSGWQKVQSWPLGSWSCPTSNPRGSVWRGHVSQARWEAEDRGCVWGGERERELRNSRTCHLLRVILKQSEAVSFKVPALLSGFEAQACTHFAITQVLCNNTHKTHTHTKKMT